MSGALVGGWQSRTLATGVLHVPALALIALLVVPSVATVYLAAGARPLIVVCCAAVVCAAWTMRRVQQNHGLPRTGERVLWSLWLLGAVAAAAVAAVLQRWGAATGWAVAAAVGAALLGLWRRISARRYLGALLPTSVAVAAVLIVAWTSTGRESYAITVAWVVLTVILLGLIIAMAWRLRRTWWPWWPLIVPFGVSAFVAGLAWRLIFEPLVDPVTSVWLQAFLYLVMLGAAFVWVWFGALFVLVRAAIASIEADPVRGADLAGRRGLARWRRLGGLLSPVLVIVGLVVTVAAARVFDIILVGVPGPQQYTLDSVTLHWWYLPADTGADRAAAAAFSLPLAVLVGLIAWLLQMGTLRQHTRWPAAPRTAVPVHLRMPTGAAESGRFATAVMRIVGTAAEIRIIRRTDIERTLPGPGGRCAGATRLVARALDRPAAALEWLAAHVDSLTRWLLERVLPVELRAGWLCLRVGAVSLLVLAPLVVLVAMSWLGPDGAALVGSGAVWRDSELWRALRNSALVAVVASALTVLAALPPAYYAAALPPGRVRSRGAHGTAGGARRAARAGVSGAHPVLDRRPRSGGHLDAIDPDACGDRAADRDSDPARRAARAGGQSAGRYPPRPRQCRVSGARGGAHRRTGRGCGHSAAAGPGMERFLYRATGARRGCDPVVAAAVERGAANPRECGASRGRCAAVRGAAGGAAARDLAAVSGTRSHRRRAAMTSAEHAHDAESGAAESSAQAVAKSSMWQGLLRTASVLATSMLLEIVSKLLENQVGQSVILSPVSSWLSRIAVLVVIAAAAYVLARRATHTWERTRAQRELRLTADLISPGAEVRSWPPATGVGPDDPVRQVNPGLAGQGEWLGNAVLAVLSALPFERYEAAALYDMVSAILTARQRLPQDVILQGRSAATEIERLTAAGLLGPGTRDRMVVWSVLPAAAAAWIMGTPEWAAALPALVKHHADRATRWAAALDTRRLGAGARRWFEQEDTYLAALLRECRAIDSLARAAAVPELIRLADALDRWYARNGWSAAKDDLAQCIVDFTTPAAQPVEHELAQVRLGVADISSTVSWLHRAKTSLVARRDQRRAMDLLQAGWTDATKAAVLDEAAALLERAWGRVPARDAQGAVCILVDLAIVRLHRGSLDAARNCLAVAQALAADDRDPAGLAHVYETLGVLRWQRGEARRALHDWQRALTRYRELDHALGIARCLQHLGSAMVLWSPSTAGSCWTGHPGAARCCGRPVAGWNTPARCGRPGRPGIRVRR